MRHFHKPSIKLLVGILSAQALLVSSSPAASITINDDVGDGTITNGAGITVDGWVYDAQTFSPNNPEQVLSTNANKVKCYLMYQQIRTNEDIGEPGSRRYLLDSTAANFSNGSSKDTPYSGNLTANMPDQETTAITPDCWFLHCEALLDTPQSPNEVVGIVEKSVDLAYAALPGSGS